MTIEEFKTSVYEKFGEVYNCSVFKNSIVVLAKYPIGAIYFKITAVEKIDKSLVEKAFDLKELSGSIKVYEQIFKK